MTDIVTIPGGLPFALDWTGRIINASWEQANEKAAAYDAKVTDAVSTWLSETSTPTMDAPTVTAATVTEPPVSIPSEFAVSDVYDEFAAQYEALVPVLTDKFAAFIAAWFPNDATTISRVENWLNDTIANGMDSGVQAQMVEEDRSRILAEATRAGADVLAGFASKGFPLPPGAAAHAILTIENTAQSEIAKSSRAATIQGVELVKFAIDKAANLRQGAISAAGDYMKSIIFGQELASKVVGLGRDTESKLISAASAFMNARTEAKKLTFAGAQLNATMAQEAAKSNLQAELTIVESKLKALLSEAQALGQMATSLFNNLHASVGGQSNYAETKDLTT